jgi:hypothetical protein
MQNRIRILPIVCGNLFSLLILLINSSNLTGSGRLLLVVDIVLATSSPILCVNILTIFSLSVFIYLSAQHLARVCSSVREVRQTTKLNNYTNVLHMFQLISLCV